VLSFVARKMQSVSLLTAGGFKGVTALLVHLFWPYRFLGDKGQKRAFRHE